MSGIPYQPGFGSGSGYRLQNVVLNFTLQNMQFRTFLKLKLCVIDKTKQFDNLSLSL